MSQEPFRGRKFYCDECGVLRGTIVLQSKEMGTVVYVPSLEAHMCIDGGIMDIVECSQNY